MLINCCFCFFMTSEPFQILACSKKLLLYVQVSSLIVWFVSLRFLHPCPPPPCSIMPVLKNLPMRLKGGSATLDNALILRRMSLNITPHHHSPFHNDDDEHGGHGNHWSPGSSLLDGDSPRDRNPFEDEEDENEANEGKRGGGGGSSGKGSLKIKSPLKTLGKIGRSLRMSGRSKESTTTSPHGSIQGTPPPSDKKKRGRRRSEGSLLR